MRVFSSASRAILHALRVRDAPPAVGRPAPVADPALSKLISPPPRADRPGPGVVSPLSRVPPCTSRFDSRNARQTLRTSRPLSRNTALLPRASHFPARPRRLSPRSFRLPRAPARFPRSARRDKEGNNKAPKRGRAPETASRGEVHSGCRGPKGGSATGGPHPRANGRSFNFDRRSRTRVARAPRTSLNHATPANDLPLRAASRGAILPRLGPHFAAR